MKMLNTQHISYPSNVSSTGCVEIIAVLTREETTFNQTHCVYIGQGTDEFVMYHGDKIPFEHALLYFPGLKKELYRS